MATTLWELALPKSRLGFGVHAIAPLVSAFEKVRKAVPFGDEIAYRLGSYWIKTAISERAELHAREPAPRSAPSSRDANGAADGPAAPTRPRSAPPPSASLNGAI